MFKTLVQLPTAPIIDIANYDRMFVYVWHNVLTPNRCKFGEKWVASGKDATKMVSARIRESLSVEKQSFDDGLIIIDQSWDVTDYSKKYNRHYKQSRVDDHIRHCIGHRAAKKGEIHNITAIEATLKINNYLSNCGQPLKQIGLAAWQEAAAFNILTAINNGKKTIMAELCARFGKTIWGGALIKERNVPLTIIASYVLTSFTSFQNDLSGYEQFKDLVLVDLADNDYEETITAAIDHGKQVVAFLSLCNGDNRCKRIKHLFDLDCDRMLIIDEADFGAHQFNQAKALIKAKKANDVVILMTGTNADKAASYWSVDHYISTVYLQLLMEKYNPKPFYPSRLQHFNVDSRRHKLVVDIEFYQMDLMGVVNAAREIDPALFIEDGKFLPSWSKFAAYPIKAKGFWNRMLTSIFLGHNGHDELNIDFHKNEADKLKGRVKSANTQRVAMMFLSGSITNVNLGDAVKLAEEALPGYDVIGVYGEEMSNRTATSEVKEAIERAARANRHVLLLSAGMAQRSFSVGQITELYLAYDRGDYGATVQKISRALTPDNEGKVGRIVSLSFDPNRDDKFDGMLLETAINIKELEDIANAREAVNHVLRTIDIFKCTQDGVTKLTVDEYLAAAIERDSVTRVVGKVCNLSVLSNDQIRGLASGDADVFRAATVAATQSGKTRELAVKTDDDSTSEKTQKATDWEKTMSKARKMAVTIAENLDIIIEGTGEKDIMAALDVIDGDDSMQKVISEEFNVDYYIVKTLLHTRALNVDFIDLQCNQ